MFTLLDEWKGRQIMITTIIVITRIKYWTVSYTSHCTLHTVHFTLYTSHSARHGVNSIPELQLTPLTLNFNSGIRIGIDFLKSIGIGIDFVGIIDLISTVNLYPLNLLLKSHLSAISMSP